MFMKKFIKKQVSLSIMTVMMIAVVLIGSSYALFQESFSDTNTQTLNVGDLNVAFSNTSNNELTDNDAIDITNLTPMPDTTALTQTDNLYSFVVTNNGNISYCYTIKLQDNPNYTTNLLNHQYIRIKFNDDEPMMLSETTNGYLIDHTINPGETDSYTLRIWVADAEEYLLPNEAIGQEVHLNIVIEGEACPARAPKNWENAPSGSLLAGIKSNNTTPNASCTKAGQVVSTTNEGLCETEDDYGISYYYRGVQESNYVSFANMCWRIVRIDGLGNVKLTLYNYNPTSASNPCDSSLDAADAAFARYGSTTSGLAGKSPYKTIPYDKNAYIGLKYGTAASSTYDNEHSNNNNSTILTSLETWFSEKLIDYNDKLADVIWCNDKSLATEQLAGTTDYTNIGYGAEKTWYSGAERLVSRTEYNNYSNASPSLNCNQTNGTINNLSKYTVNTDAYGGNGKLQYKVGLLTADEITFAGGLFRHDNTSYYIYKNASSEYWWTMTPFSFDGSYAYIFHLSSNGYLNFNYADYSGGLRPAIALKSNVTISGGNGTQANPFVVE